jgi:hypothetical protein
VPRCLNKLSVESIGHLVHVDLKGIEIDAVTGLLVGGFLASHPERTRGDQDHSSTVITLRVRGNLHLGRAGNWEEPDRGANQHEQAHQATSE